MAAAIVALACTAAYAEPTARDIQVMARAIGFINGLPRGVVDVAVVDGAGAQEVMDAMRGRVSAGGVTLNPRRVPADELSGSGVRIIIVPEGQASMHASIAAAARRLGAATLSTDMNCVRNGHCVVGVAAQPRVEILVSRRAADAAGVSFAQAFRVMIREI